MIDSESQSIVGAKLVEFHLAPTRSVHLCFLQDDPEQLVARPERLCTQIWLIRPERISLKMSNRDRLLTNVKLEQSRKGVTSIWSFGDGEMLSVECKSISHVFFPVVTWIV